MASRTIWFFALLPMLVVTSTAQCTHPSADAVFFHDFESVAGDSITAFVGPFATKTSSLSVGAVDPFGTASMQHLTAPLNDAFATVDTNARLLEPTAELSFSTLYNARGETTALLKRMLSTYDGTGGVPTSQLVFDRLHDGRLRFTAGVGEVYSDGTIPSDNAWHQVGFSISGTQLRFFLDGAPFGTDKTLAAAQIQPQTYNWHLVEDALAVSTVNEYFFGGDYDNAGLWYRALSDAEMAMLAADLPAAPCAGNIVSVGPASLTAIPFNPGPGVPVTISVQVSNVGATSALMEVLFHEGPQQFGGLPIGTQQVTLGFGQSTTAQTSWTPTTTGPATITVTVNCLDHAEGVLGDNRASRSLTVGAPPESLTIEAGSVTAWPGASFTTPVTIRNTGSAVAMVTGASSPHAWATIQNPPSGVALQPGDTSTLLVDVAVPVGTPGGTIGEAPTSYAVPVAVTTPAATFSDEVDGQIYDQPVAQVTLRVEDDVTNTPIAGALVTVESVPGQLVTDAMGEVIVDLPEGPRGFFAYKPGYVAAAITATVASGPGTVVIPLTPGQTLQVTSISVVPLTAAQILARGVNVLDPVNNHLVDFVISLAIGTPIASTVVLPSVEVPTSPSAPYTVSGVAWPSGTGGSGSGPVQVTGVIEPLPMGGTSETWILIAGQVQALLQFFDVTMYLANNAVAPTPTDVQLQNVDATLALPAGLGLPDLDGVPQGLTQSVGTLDAGTSAQATWVIRGDLPGTYALSGTATADLHAFGTFSNTLSATATGEPFDVVLPDLRLEFIVPNSVTMGQAFTADILVTNEQSVPANFVTVRLIHDPDHPLVDYLVELSPTQPSGVTVAMDGMGTVIEAEMALGTIEPGQSALASFQVISPATGSVLSGGVQHWSSTSPVPTITIAPHYPGTDPACSILTGVDEPLDDLSLKVAYAGQTADILIEAPAYVGEPMLLAVGLFYDGMTPLELFPGIWVGGGLGTIIQPPQPVLPTGNAFGFTAVPGYADFSFLVQGVVASPSAPGGYCATDAHEFRILP